MFRFDLEIPFIHIYTALMYRCFERRTIQYIAWNIKIWKWHWILEWGKEEK